MSRGGVAIPRSTARNGGETVWEDGPLRSFDGAYSLYESGDKQFMGGKHPYWSWCHVTASNVQTGSVTRLEQVKAVEDHLSGVNDPKMYDRYLTQGALMRLGRA